MTDPSYRSHNTTDSNTTSSPNFAELLTLHTRSNLLRSITVSFCSAFLSSTSPKIILDTYFTSSPRITEYGPSWASSRLPFLGTFIGRPSTMTRTTTSKPCDDYFAILSETLTYQPGEMKFPSPEEFIVDAAANAVSVKAHARFSSVKTGEGWEEKFVYKLSEFDEKGRIGHWEIWADPLSAWEAVGE
jgi:hypothetical protein